MNSINRLKDIINYIKNPKLYFLVGFVILIIVGLIILLNHKKGKWLLWISIPTICNAMIFITSKLLFPKIIIKILQKANNETLNTFITPFVNSFFNSLFKYGLVLFGISVIMIIIYIIAKKHSKE